LPWPSGAGPFSPSRAAGWLVWWLAFSLAIGLCLPRKPAG
jgi:hypothetical protein